MLKARSFQDVYRLFHFMSKVTGFATFCYPSDGFRMSIFGTISGLLNSTIWLLLCYQYVEEFSTKNADSVSEVFQVGIVIIRGLILFSVLSCQIMNFIQRKEIFKLLRLFEKLNTMVRFFSGIEYITQNLNFTNSYSQMDPH